MTNSRQPGGHASSGDRTDSSGPEPHQSRRLRTVAVVVALIAVAVPALIAAQLWLGSNDVDPEPEPGSPPDAGEQPDEGDPTPDPPQPTPDAEPPAEVPTFGVNGLVTVADLGTGVAVLGDDGTLALLTADGDRRVLTDGLGDATQLRLFADRHGGVVWQAVDNTADVLHVDAQGQTRLLRAAGPDERITLVGIDHDRDGALVVRAVGANPDDTVGDVLAIPLDAAEPAVLREHITAWESGLSFAAYGANVLLYGLFDAAFEGVFVWPDTGETALLLEAGEMTGEYIRGIAIADEATGVVLVETAAGFPDLPQARLLLVDLAAADVVAEVTVPMELGAQDSWHVPRDVSAAGRFVLVNRYAEGIWLAPLVHDLASGNWAVLDGAAGRALLSHPDG